jgi:hypothetical protein
MIRLRHILILAAAACAFAVAAVPASANYLDVIRECYNTGQLTPGRYSRHDLKQARTHLPSDIKEYSDCEDLINAALAAGSRKGGGAGGGGGGASGAPPASAAPNPALTTRSGATAGSQQDLNALNAATDPKNNSVRPAVPVAGSKLSPSTGGLINAAKRTDANSVPLPLILSLAALAAMAALAGAAVLRQRWPGIRRVAPRFRRR